MATPKPPLNPQLRKTIRKELARYNPSAYRGLEKKFKPKPITMPKLPEPKS